MTDKVPIVEVVVPSTLYRWDFFQLIRYVSRKKVIVTMTGHASRKRLKAVVLQRNPDSLKAGGITCRSKRRQTRCYDATRSLGRTAANWNSDENCFKIKYKITIYLTGKHDTTETTIKHFFFEFLSFSNVGNYNIYSGFFRKSMY